MEDDFSYNNNNDEHYNTNSYIGQAIRDFRLANNVTLSKMADELGVSYQQLQKYEKGINRISAEKLYEVSAMLGVEPGYFFPGSVIGTAPHEENLIKLVQSYNSLSDKRLQAVITEMMERVMGLQERY